MSLDMLGHIDDCFESVPATRTSNAGGAYIDGLWVDGGTTSEPHKVTLQPLSDKEIDNLDIGGRRILDSRRVYVNDGDLYSITPADTWAFEGVDGVFECKGLDNRPWRNYCKVLAVRLDG